MLLAHEFGWTPDIIRSLYRSELVSILKELGKQKKIESYTEMKNKWAFMAAVIVNSVAQLAYAFGGKRKPKTIKAEDFLDKKYAREIEKAIKGEEIAVEKKYAWHIKDAQQKGLNVPTGGV